MKIRLLIKLSRIPLIGIVFRIILLFLGLDIPREVELGKNVVFEHYGIGVIIHPKTKIDDNVRIYPNVTIGRADVHIKSQEMKGFHIQKNVIIGTGAKVLCKKGVLKIGENTIIAANSVLLESTGENEIWGGIPARKIGIRNDLS